MGLPWTPRATISSSEGELLFPPFLSGKSDWRHKCKTIGWNWCWVPTLPPPLFFNHLFQIWGWVRLWGDERWWVEQRPLGEKFIWHPAIQVSAGRDFRKFTSFLLISRSRFFIDFQVSYLVVISPSGETVFSGVFGDKEGNNTGMWRQIRRIEVCNSCFDNF